MEWCCASVAVVAIIGFGVAVSFGANRQSQLKDLLARINSIRSSLSGNVSLFFMVQPCFRCHEFSMTLLEVSPNGRSVHYQCLHCKKKTHAPAGTPQAFSTIEKWSELLRIVNEYNQLIGPTGQVEMSVVFDAPAAPLPYEQTTRTPIPEAIRSEVWRRDSGVCVQCGSKQNLQFDHIIPIAQGGSTTVVNLQLLCQPCNGSKGKKI